MSLNHQLNHLKLLNFIRLKTWDSSTGLKTFFLKIKKIINKKNFYYYFFFNLYKSIF